MIKSYVHVTLGGSALKKLCRLIIYWLLYEMISLDLYTAIIISLYFDRRLSYAPYNLSIKQKRFIKRSNSQKLFCPTYKKLLNWFKLLLLRFTCSIPMAAGHFDRDVYVEANKRWDFKFEKGNKNQKSSSVCAIQWEMIKGGNYRWPSSNGWENLLGLRMFTWRNMENNDILECEKSWYLEMLISQK